MGDFDSVIVISPPGIFVLFLTAFCKAVYKGGIPVTQIPIKNLF